jgi:hypothetical protein
MLTASLIQTAMPFQPSACAFYTEPSAGSFDRSGTMNANLPEHHGNRLQMQRVIIQKHKEQQKVGGF